MAKLLWTSTPLEKHGRPWDEFDPPRHDAQHDSRGLASDGGSQEYQSDGEWMHVEGKEAAQNFGDSCLHLVYLPKLSPLSACVLSWWASKAGAAGMAERLASRPNAPTGHFQSHIEAVVGVDDIRHRRDTMSKPPYTTKACINGRLWTSR